MKPLALFLLLALGLLPCAHADLTLVRDGKTQYVIVRQAGITAPEQNALSELAAVLSELTGATFPILEAGGKIPSRAIFVGQGTEARRWFPDVPFDQLGQEEIVIRTRGNRLLLAGGRPRGTLYAVAQFLQDQCGVRWWTPWATHVPRRPTLTLKPLDVRYAPPFESRDPFWHAAFNARWAVRNFSNSQSAAIPEDWGGCIRYRGFVHTFYPLVPPADHFASHPEWYSLLKGQRTHEHGQLCLTNPDLRRFVVERVKQWLKESPEARIVSVSQNDWYGACECERCKAMDDAEGSHAGTMLDFVNYVAGEIAAEFPQVAIDTLAYQYTRKPPKTIRPRPNVIVRLCSIECNFREPLDHPSNASFADDIRGWAKICNRLYIWDYTTDFGHYVQPHPNYYVLGPNLRFFQQHHVKGVFEQGAYQAYGSEFGELRAWVLAQLLWNPAKDDRALIQEFLGGYYGAAAPAIQRYMNLMSEAARGYNLTCFSKTDTPFHNLTTLVEAERLWQQAEAAATASPELLARVRLGHLPVRYAFLNLWEKLRRDAKANGVTWPLPESRKAVADEWLKVAQGVPNWEWTKIKLINESGLTPEKFVERFAQDPPEPRAQAASPPGSAQTQTPTASSEPRPAQGLSRIAVGPGGHGFVTDQNQAFVPMGVNYFRPGTGWAPQVWKQFDAEATRKDFARLRELGANCVRVFLSYGSFCTEPGALAPDGVEKLDRFLALAEEAGLYVHPTGPDHWEGTPEWARTDRYADDQTLTALETFWRQLAGRYRGRHVLFAYDLLNEPEIRWDTPAMRGKWKDWVLRQHGSLDRAFAAWGGTVKKPEDGSAPIPPRETAAGPHLLDYQHFREDLADEWTRRQVAAIKSADPQALVTVGLIQWSVPVALAGPFHYSAFRPERQARLLDFMEIHFYPLARGFYEYSGPEAEMRNLAYAECVVSEVARWGKPTVVAEFGWYGGGKLTINEGKHPPATEEQQAQWCRRLIETTSGMACGWLNWGFHDHPQARDVTELTGLLTADGRVKAWGRTFHELAKQFQTTPPPARTAPARIPLDYDRLIADRQAISEYLDRYYEAFRAGAGKGGDPAKS